MMFVNGSQVVGGADSQLLELDFDAKTSRVVLDSGLGATWSFVDGSVVCGDLWYGVASNFPVGMAIAIVDISSPTGKLVGIQSLDFKPHHIKCGKAFGELITVGADNGNPTTFHLYRVSNLTSAVSPTSTIIGTFPKVGWAGYPSIFQFTEDSLYVHFSKHVGIFDTGFNTGEMFKMDLATGSISIHKQYEGAPGMPVFVTSSDGKSWGVFGKPTGGDEHAYDYSLCQVDASGSKVKVSQCKKDTERKWFNIQIPATCPGDNKYYFHSAGSQTHSDTPFFAADMSSGDLAQVFDLQGDFVYPSEYYAGAMTCSASSSTSRDILV